MTAAGATVAIEADGLGKRYRRGWAVEDCSFRLPAGRVCGLVGANGAGKSTLIRMLAGLARPTAGRAAVDGRAPDGNDPGFLRSVGYLAQDVPLYPRWTARAHLALGAALNPAWDQDLARDRLDLLGIPLDQRVEQLSGGMRAQVALAVAIGKRPRVLLLDEPVAALDPLARREFLASLAVLMAGHDLTVLLSSHLLPDLERICDHLVVLVEGRAVLADDVDEIIRTHKLVRGPESARRALARRHRVVDDDSAGPVASAVVRLQGPEPDPACELHDLSLEDIVLAYLAGARAARTVPDLALAGAGEGR